MAPILDDAMKRLEIALGLLEALGFTAAGSRNGGAATWKPNSSSCRTTAPASPSSSTGR